MAGSILSDAQSRESALLARIEALEACVEALRARVIAQAGEVTTLAVCLATHGVVEPDPIAQAYKGAAAEELKAGNVVAAQMRLDAAAALEYIGPLLARREAANRAEISAALRRAGEGL